MSQLKKTCWTQQQSERGKGEERKPKDPCPRGASHKGAGITPKLKTSSSSSPTPILSVESVVLSQAGLYSKRKELKVLFALVEGLALVNKSKRTCSTLTITDSCKSKANGLIYFVCKNKMFDNKLVKTLNNSATLTGLAAGIGWVAKRVIKELMTTDLSSNLMSYMKFAAKITVRQYLEHKKILQS